MKIRNILLGSLPALTCISILIGCSLVEGKGVQPPLKEYNISLVMPNGVEYKSYTVSEAYKPHVYCGHGITHIGTDHKIIAPSGWLLEVSEAQ